MSIAPTREWKNVSPEDMIKILAEVKEHHDWPFDGHMIKYVNFYYDNRSHDIFTVHFRGTIHETTFTVTNRCESYIDLFQEIMDWLVEGRNKKYGKSIKNTVENSSSNNASQISGK